MRQILLYWIVFFLCIFEFSNCSGVNETEYELIFSQIIFRHGHRNIQFTYENDPYKDKVNWPEGLAQLTNLGKQQAFELGKYFKRRYEKLLGDGSYHPDKVYTVSSDVDRAINSASLVLSGLFPPQNNQIWNKDLLWQPISVHDIPQSQDYLIRSENGCPRYEKVLKEYEQTAEINGILDQHQELLQYLETHAGQPIRNLKHIKDLWGTLSIEHMMNKTLPEWTQKVFVLGGDFNYLNDYWYKMLTDTTELKRLKAGFLLKEILERFKNKSRSTLSPDLLLYMYSSHETTMISVLNSLGLFELHIPPYSSCLLFELYKSSDDYYVQLFYRKPNEENPSPLNIPNCGNKCSLDRLFELYSDILPSDPDECKL